MAKLFGPCFRNKLRKLGYASYDDYLASDHWREKRAEYAASGLPKACVGCGSPSYQLHHRSYSRLGREPLCDFLPLCDGCHAHVHEYHRHHETSIQATHKILRIVFGWSKDETARRLAPFSIGGPGHWVDREAVEVNKTKLKVRRRRERSAR